jgi:beta-glucosidase
MKNTIMKTLHLGAACCMAACTGQPSHEAERNEFVTRLMSRMTLEEKIGQLNLPTVGFDVTGPTLSEDVEQKIKNGQVGGVFNTFTPVAVRKLQEIAVTQTRLHIPLLFGYDVIHGHRTIYPIPFGLSATWDTELVERVAAAVADEASADGLHWTFSPMVDIARDPRWGRVSEGAGEDPYLGAEMAKAMVRGYEQGDLRKENTLMSCIKHFALYGAAEAGRDYNTTDMSRLRMYNEYLPPYKAAVDAGASSVMTAFNEVDGVPATGNHWLLTDLLRRQWGFGGFVVTDYTAIMEMEIHGVGNKAKAAELAVNAGADMDMVSEYFIDELPALVKDGKVKEETIDAACRRILEAKYKLGLFTDPYRGLSEARAEAQIMNAEKLALSKEAALKSAVLLKNDRQTLPLDASKKIAFIGPLVNDQRNLIGNWSAAGNPQQAVSLWSALQSKFGGHKFSYAKGCNLTDDTQLLSQLNRHGGDITPDSRTPQQLLAEALQVARQADVVVAVLGESFGMSGEAASRTDIALPDNQKTLLKALKAIGKPVALVLMNGRPLTLQWEHDHLDAILETWYAGTCAGDAIADILFGDANPSGKITMTFPRSVGQIPIYYNHKNTGRPFNEKEKYTTKYLDASNEPLYPFGHGLSYTQFTYSGIQLSDTVLTTGSITATVTLTNNGNYTGEEVVQLYIRDRVGSITRPVKELKGFRKVALQPGESRQISFAITPEQLKFYNADLQWTAEPGDFWVFIGGSSATENKAAFELK